MAVQEPDNNDTPFNMRIEVVPIPVSDVDRAKAFYADQVGFHLDFDTQHNDTVRTVQLTPVGSACSIAIGTGLGEISTMKPGSIKGVHLVVKDIRATCAALNSRGVETSEVVEYPRGIKFSGFSDPDGNMWVLQEIPPGL